MVLHIIMVSSERKCCGGNGGNGGDGSGVGGGSINSSVKEFFGLCMRKNGRVLIVSRRSLSPGGVSLSCRHSLALSHIWLPWGRGNTIHNASVIRLTLFQQIVEG